MSSAGLSWVNDPGGYIQSLLGSPVTVTSGLRSPAHNMAVGGVPNSDHLAGSTYDFVPQGMPMQDAFAALQASGAPIKQSLNEGNHIHVAFDQNKAPPVDSIDAMLAAHATGASTAQPAPQQADPIDAALAAQATAKVSNQAFPNTSVSASNLPKYGVGIDWVHQASGGLIDKLGAAVGATFPSIGPNVVANDPTWSGRYQKTLQNIRAGFSGYENTEPTGAKVAKVGGVIAPMLVGGGAPSGILGAIGKNAAMGAAYGFGGTNDSSLMGDLGAAGMGGLFGGAIGAAGHGVGAIGGNAVGAIADRVAGAQQSSGQRLAANTLTDSLARDGVNPADLIAQLQGTSKPLTPMDIGGENSALARQGRMLTVLPGQSGKDITDFLNTRQAGQRGRVLSDIAQIAPNTDTYGTQAGLSRERSVNSDPLYQQAFASAGVGPVDYEAARSDMINATAQKGAIAKQVKSIEQNNSGALAARGAAGAGIRQNYMDLQGQLQQAEAARLAAASKFQNVQAGVSAMESDQPLTDQRLAAFLKDPDIQAGMQKGLNIQRRLALANNEDFDPNAYAITGYDEKGLPQVGPVPTWRTLHAGREGLDATLNEFRDPVTQTLPNTKLVNSYKELRKAYSDHLQLLNPDMKAADAAWSGPSQQKDAINLGGDFLKADPEQITQITGRMNDATLPYYRVGAGRSLRDVANDTRDNNNIPLRLNSDQTTRDQIGAAFGPSNAANFSGNMDLENKMAKTRQFVTGGSNTANKQADLQRGGVLPVIQHAISGALAGGLHGALVLPAVNVARRASMTWAENLLNNPAKNQELANVLTSTGPDAAAKIQHLLAAAQRRQRAAAVGKMVGNAAGRGAIAGSLPALMAPAANNGP